MREITANEIVDTVKRLFIEANYFLPCDLTEQIESARKLEQDELCSNVLSDILENLDAAKELHVPICQDTGMAVLFIKLGQEVHIIGGSFNDAVNEGVRQAYLDGNLRCSIVADPLERINTNDNTPAIIHMEMTSGDKIEITAAPKGFGK